MIKIVPRKIENKALKNLADGLFSTSILVTIPFESKLTVKTAKNGPDQ